MIDEKSNSFFPKIRSYSSHPVEEEWQGLKSNHWGNGGLRVFEIEGNKFAQGKFNI